MMVKPKRNRQFGFDDKTYAICNGIPIGNVTPIINPSVAFFTIHHTCLWGGIVRPLTEFHCPSKYTFAVTLYIVTGFTRSWYTYAANASILCLSIRIDYSFHIQNRVFQFLSLSTNLVKQINPGILIGYVIPIQYPTIKLCSM